MREDILNKVEKYYGLDDIQITKKLMDYGLQGIELSLVRWDIQNQLKGLMDK